MTNSHSMNSIRIDTKLQTRYATWIAETESKGVANLRPWNLGTLPKISVLMPVFNIQADLLVQAIESVVKQTFSNWELCIADDASTESHIRPILINYSQKDPRIKVVYREKNGHISEASNSALDLVSGEYLALLDHDDLLHPDALSYVADAILNFPEAKILYSDEDKIDLTNRRTDPYFKCDFNYDLFLSQNLISHLGVFNTKLVRDVGGFRNEFCGSQDYDLAFRCIEQVLPSQIIHIPKILYHWRILQGSVSLSINEKPYATQAAEKAINAHLNRMGIHGLAETDGLNYRVRYNIPSPFPMVSIVIGMERISRWTPRYLQSLLDKTLYPNFEVLVMQPQSNRRRRDCHDRWGTDRRVRFLECKEIEISAQFRAGVREASGSVLTFLHDDIEIISPDWLNEMVSHALRSGVGAVGAKLWYPQGFIQHAGFILGIGGPHDVCLPAHQYLPKSLPGYFGRANTTQTFLAVSSACLVIRRAIYDEVNGMNDIDLPLNFYDVDFCLRVRQAGYRNVWTPYAQLVHHEPPQLPLMKMPIDHEILERECSFMWNKWRDLLNKDPAYSQNLSRNGISFQFPFWIDNHTYSARDLLWSTRLLKPLRMGLKVFEKKIIRPIIYLIRKSFNRQAL